MKRDMPFVFREAMEILLAKYVGLLNIKIEHPRSIRVTETNAQDSDYRFIVMFVKDATGITYSVNHKPASLEDADQILHQRQSIDSVSEHLKTWLDLTKKYNSPSQIFDDPITDKYYNDLEELFNTADEDADYNPHSFEEQKALAEYYDIATKLIEVSDIDEAEANKLKSEINEAKRNISKSTKKQNISRLRKLISNAWKFSRELGQQLLIEVFKEGFKWIASGQATLPF